MDLRDYITNSEKQYRMRLKSVVPLDDEAMDRIEMALQKYQPIEISRASKTMLQANPLDFIGVENAEVWIVDLVLGLPATPTFVRQDIRRALNAPETYVVVRNENEPIETYTEIMAAERERNEAAAKAGLRRGALLDTGKEYPEYEETPADTLFGDAYNSAFLNMLAGVEAERRDARVVQPSAPVGHNTLADFEDMPDREDQEPVQSDADYNAGIKGAPKVGKQSSTAKIANRPISGGVNDASRVPNRIWTDKKGESVVLEPKVRKG